MKQLLGARLRPALKMAGVHLLLSVLLASVVALLVFKIWFPAPYDQLIHGRQLFVLITAVDVVCGPLLTLVLFNPLKPKNKWRVDVALIALTQCVAFGYGLSQLAMSRPILLAFEGDRFRVVQAADVDVRALPQAPESMRALSWTGPELVGVQLLEPTDPEYPKSVELAMQGIHPAFRPIRWMPYEQMNARMTIVLRPMAELEAKFPKRMADFRGEEQRLGLSAADLGFLPLVSGTTTDWVVVVRRKDMSPVGYWNLDSW